jgi:hypothetical protein
MARKRHNRNCTELSLAETYETARRRAKLHGNNLIVKKSLGKLL